MTAKSANVFESFYSLVEFYPKLSASIAFGIMAAATNSMKAFGSVGIKSAELIETPPLPSLSIPEGVRSTRQPKKNRPVARKSMKRSPGRRKAA
jgi:hypothetical protein